MISDYYSILSFGAVIPQSDDSWSLEIPAKLKRRDPKIWHLAYVCTARAKQNLGVQIKSCIVGTALGALNETKSFLDKLYDTGFGSPTNFMASVHNSIAGKIALEFLIDGPNLTVCDGQNSLASAIFLCESLNDSFFPCLILAIDEYIDILKEISPHISTICAESLSFDSKEIALALILDKNSQSNNPLIRASMPVYYSEEKFGFANIKSNIEDLFNLKYDNIIFCEPDVNSFSNIPQHVYKILKDNIKGKFLLPCFSPTSKAYSFLEIIL
jgi:hypothetical protein